MYFHTVGISNKMGGGGSLVLTLIGVVTVAVAACLLPHAVH